MSTLNQVNFLKEDGNLYLHLKKIEGNPIFHSSLSFFHWKAELGSFSLDVIIIFFIAKHLNKVTKISHILKQNTFFILKPSFSKTCEKKKLLIGYEEKGHILYSNFSKVSSQQFLKSNRITTKTRNKSHPSQTSNEIYHAKKRNFSLAVRTANSPSQISQKLFNEI